MYSLPNYDPQLIEKYNADPQWRAELSAKLKNAAESYYSNKPQLNLQSLMGALHGESDAESDLTERPKSLAAIESFLKQNGFKGFARIGSGYDAVVVGDGEKVARITVARQDNPDLLQPDTPEYLQPYVAKMFKTSVPGEPGPYAIKVEVLPQLVQLEDVKKRGLITSDDADIVNAIVQAGICRSNPELAKNPLLTIEGGASAIGLIPDGTPLLYDRNAISLQDCSEYKDSQPPPPVTVDCNWRTRDGKSKQDEYFPKGKSATDWTAKLGERTGRKI